VPTVSGGPWLVEAGTYLNKAALNSVETKIRALGYEPRVSTTKKNVRMIRLRIGTVAEGNLKEALAKARTIVPEAFALRSGGMFAVYAGTFADPQNLLQMSERLTNQGFKVQEEPVEVMRTISLVRFGGFNDKTAADEAANRARRAGIAAEVVKPR
jgi:cell division septation protein DedD